MTQILTQEPTRPTTLLDAFNLFLEAPESQTNKKIEENLRWVLKKCLLPSYDFSSNYWKTRDIVEQQLASIPLEDLTKANILFENNLKALIKEDINLGTLNNLRSIFERFWNWLNRQDWFEEIVRHQSSQKAPPLRSKVNFEVTRQGHRQYNQMPYSLKDSELTAKLKKQKQDFFDFWLMEEHIDRKEPRYRDVTMNSRWLSVASFLGWLHHIEGVPLEELDLHLVFNLEKLKLFVRWGVMEQKNSFTWAINIGKGALAVAKSVFGIQSKRRNYSDIEVIEDIRDLMKTWENKSKAAGKRTTSQTALTQRLIPLEDCFKVIQYLQECCRHYTARNKKRPELAIASNFQCYLLIKLLTYCPGRQREFRELELNRTLFREADEYFVRLDVDDHKTGSKTGKGRVFAIPDELTEDLDEWLQRWRPLANPQHNLVFLSLSHSEGACNRKAFGQPLNQHTFGKLVQRTMFRATAKVLGEGKAITPHDFRRIAITYAHKNGTYQQQVGLAELMGHSVEVARKTYSQLNGRDLTDMAKGWWKSKDGKSKPQSKEFSRSMPPAPQPPENTSNQIPANTPSQMPEPAPQTTMNQPKLNQSSQKDTASANQSDQKASETSSPAPSTSASRTPKPRRKEQSETSEYQQLSLFPSDEAS